MNLPIKLGESFKEIILKVNFKKVNPEKLKRALLVIYTLLLFATLYHFIYARRIIPGVKVAGVRIGGKTFAQARKALEDREKTVIKELKLKFEDEEFIIRPEDIGLVYDWDASVSRAFEVGRTGNLFVDTKEKIAGLVKNLIIPASYDYDGDALGIKFSIIRGEVNKEVRQAGVVLTDGKLIVSASDKGGKVVEDDLYSTVISSFDSFNFSDKNIPIKIIGPQILEKDVAALLPEIEKIIAKDLIIVYGTKKWTLTSQQLLDLVDFEKDKGKVKTILNEPRFDAFVETIAGEVNELPRGQVTSVDGKTVLEFKIVKDGKELNASKFSDALEESMLGERTVVQLPINVVTGPSDMSKYGIYALLGEGTSHFAHSIPNRIHNLTLAAEKTNGVLVAPGEVYSMNNSIGEVDWEHGFQMAYIIKGDRTVLGAGGGVCQTSTTLFRAILNAGLPVVMRYPHAYRVGYYEQDMSVGFDAAVFQPSWDLKFKNDTTAYVLVQTSANLQEQSLTFKLYGTPDGRTVEITQPVVTNQIPPPAAVYQDDPTLPKGVVQQVDFPAWGANVTFTRTVKKGAEVMFSDTFNSRYQAWRAVYLVGTK